MKNNIVLIGMPGCGKSTIGVVLAKALGFDFLDSDLVIQHEKGKRLEEIIAEVGPDGFNKVEEEVNAGINVENTVIATGGSVIYGPKAMDHLAKIGHIVFIKLSCEEIEKRLGSLKERGVSIKEGQTLQDLYNERKTLYEKYAEIVVDTTGLEIKDAMALVKQNVEEAMADVL